MESPLIRIKSLLEDTFQGKPPTPLIVARASLHAVAQSCLALCDPMDCSPPGSSVHGISQARILEWVVIFSSRGSSRPKDQTHSSYVSCISRWILYHCCYLGSPNIKIKSLQNQFEVKLGSAMFSSLYDFGRIT